jgi:hypothetical protein
MVLFILKVVFPIKAISNVFIFYELKLNSWLYNLNNCGHWPLHGGNIGSSWEEHCGKHSFGRGFWCQHYHQGIVMQPTLNY